MTDQVTGYDIAVDLIDALVGLKPGSRTYEVRHHRDKVAAATQGSYNALFDPHLADLSLAERLLVALHACVLTPAPELAAHYRARLGKEGCDANLIQFANSTEPQTVSSDARLNAMLLFTRKLIENPVEGDKAALLALPAAGLTTPAVVALSQLIAFLSYQIRLVAGLKAMKASDEKETRA